MEIIPSNQLDAILGFSTNVRTHDLSLLIKFWTLGGGSRLVEGWTMHGLHDFFVPVLSKRGVVGE